MNGSVEEEAGIDSDDPTNTAMFLDESEEDELKGVAPGTPQAYKQLGQLTVKSITRQRVSQTPGRLMNGTKDPKPSVSRSSRYVNAESPSKKGRNHTALNSAMPMLTPAPQARMGSERNPTKDISVPESVRRIRSSRRASNILDKIKHASPEPKPDNSGPLVDLRTVVRNPRTGFNPNFDKNEFSPLISKLNKLKEQNNASHAPTWSQKPLEGFNADDGCKTPESKPRRYGPGTPYNMLRALSEKSSESGSNSRRTSESSRARDTEPAHEHNFGADPFMSTPVKQDKHKSSNSAPMTENRQRIESLRKLFDEHKHELMANDTMDDAKATPVPTRNRGDLLAELDSEQQQQHNEVEASYPSRISQMSSIRHSDAAAVDELLRSPSPLRPKKPLELDGAATDEAANSASSLLLSFTSKQNNDPTKPIPFLLNQIEQQQQDPQWAGDHSNLIDLSSRLNTSIYALNNGLREQFMRSSEAVPEQQARVAGDKATRGTDKPLPAETADSGRLIDATLKANTSSQSELEGQVETLRKTMEETKQIVFAIQSEIGQQRQVHVAEDTKLDDIVRLLGALDMRLHMLEDRQRLDQSISGSAASSPLTRRTNTGSTKIHPNNTQAQDMLSRLGQVIVHCLSRYPLMIIGALFIILISELIVISGVRLDVHSLNGYGRYALDEVRRHMSMPPPPPS
ncbi:hypothetical protein IWW36_000858 [Coemansia brasiliensis]|uniref:Uncharacterized protein n=1 Tax=Coemansia brasiliensis TaxID=2650707 RepID=A0A9W8IEZ2_9FUNG|nr:hypothetical protein IWW36_000858 [Coemansia brasiliensis]